MNICPLMIWILDYIVYELICEDISKVCVIVVSWILRLVQECEALPDLGHQDPNNLLLEIKTHYVPLDIMSLGLSNRVREKKDSKGFTIQCCNQLLYSILKFIQFDIHFL